jgi:hypothetical protein
LRKSEVTKLFEDLPLGRGWGSKMTLNDDFIALARQMAKPRKAIIIVAVLAGLVLLLELIKIVLRCAWG